MSDETTDLEALTGRPVPNAKKDVSGQIAWLIERLAMHEPKPFADADRLTVAVISDSEIVEYGLVLILSSHGRRIHVIRSSRMGGNCLPVEVTLINASLNTRAGLDAVDAAVKDPTSGFVVALTPQMHSVPIQRAFERGCKGCLNLTLDAADLVTALEQVGQGHTVTSPRGQGDGDALHHVVEAGPWRGHADGLSRREGEIISLIGEGFRNVEIADNLFLSINSVKSYVRSGYRKIGVESRSEAVRWGIEHGMLLDG